MKFTSALSLTLLAAFACLGAPKVSHVVVPVTAHPTSNGDVAAIASVDVSSKFDDADEVLPEMMAEDRDGIQKVLDRQVVGWNQGDIEIFMAGYWKSPELTFASGGRLTRGWQETHDRYVARYSPPDQMGHLSFDHLEFQSLGEDAALVLGQWHLKDQEGKVAEGNFSLVVRRFGNAWKIVHDHTSLTEPQSKEAADEKN